MIKKNKQDHLCELLKLIGSSPDQDIDKEYVEGSSDQVPEVKMLPCIFCAKKFKVYIIEPKFEYILHVWNMYLGDLIQRPSHPEAQVVRHLTSSASVTELKVMCSEPGS